MAKSFLARVRTGIRPPPARRERSCKGRKFSRGLAKGSSTPSIGKSATALEKISRIVAAPGAIGVEPKPQPPRPAAARKIRALLKRVENTDLDLDENKPFGQRRCDACAKPSSSAPTAALTATASARRLCAKRPMQRRFCARAREIEQRGFDRPARFCAFSTAASPPKASSSATPRKKPTARSSEKKARAKTVLARTWQAARNRPSRKNPPRQSRSARPGARQASPGRRARATFSGSA